MPPALKIINTVIYYEIILVTILFFISIILTYCVIKIHNKHK